MLPSKVERAQSTESTGAASPDRGDSDADSGSVATSNKLDIVVLSDRASSLKPSDTLRSMNSEERRSLSKWTQIMKAVNHSYTRKDEDRWVYYISVTPESFRMHFYILFNLFCLLGIIMTYAAEVKFNKNPLIDRFGAANVCLFFDDPPFTYIGAFLWVGIVLYMMIYLILDNLRVYFESREENSVITKKFYKYYSIATGYCVFSFIYFTQVFATTPYENILVHAMPYIFVQYAGVALALQHHLYFYRTKLFQKMGQRTMFLANLYIGCCFVNVGYLSTINMLNLFGARLHEHYPWTRIVGQINSPVFFSLFVFVPMIVYTIVQDRPQMEIKFEMKLSQMPSRDIEK